MRVSRSGVLALLFVARLAQSADLGQFTQPQMTSGLKDTLREAAVNAIGNLGRSDGFLGNPKVRIPLPGPLEKAQSLLKAVGMGKQADELIVAMNRAAEAAVPQAKPLVVDAVKHMTVADAKGILTGGDDAVTQYFRSHTQSPLHAKFLPIVSAATEKVGLAQKYNQLAGKASQLGMLDSSQATVQEYVTQKTLDGLYLMMAEEEKKVRHNPLQASGDLAKKIFGALR